MRRLVRSFEDGDECFSGDRATCRCSRRSRRGGRRILADLVAHLLGDVTQGLRQRLALLETLYAPVHEADPAEQQVRVVAHRHDEDDGGGDSQQLSSRGTSADIALLAGELFSSPIAQRCSCQTNKNNREYSGETGFIEQQPKNPLNQFNLQPSFNAVSRETRLIRDQSSLTK